MMLPAGNLSGHQLVPETLPAAVTFLYCVKATPLPTLTISSCARPNLTCHELSSAEITVYTQVHTAKNSCFSDLHSSLQRILWSMQITSSSPFLLPQPAFIYYYSALIFCWSLSSDNRHKHLYYLSQTKMRFLLLQTHFLLANPCIAALLN